MQPTDADGEDVQRSAHVNRYPCTSAPRFWIPDADRSQESKTEEPIPGQDTTAAGTQPNCTVAVAR